MRCRCRWRLWPCSGRPFPMREGDSRDSQRKICPVLGPRPLLGPLDTPTLVQPVPDPLAAGVWRQPGHVDDLVLEDDHHHTFPMSGVSQTIPRIPRASNVFQVKTKTRSNTYQIHRPMSNPLKTTGGRRTGGIWMLRRPASAETMRGCAPNGRLCLTTAQDGVEVRRGLRRAVCSRHLRGASCHWAPRLSIPLRTIMADEPIIGRDH